MSGRSLAEFVAMMSSLQIRFLAVVSVVALALVGLTPAEAVANGGGTVNNKDPTVPTVTGAGTFNSGATVTLTGTIRDSNKEVDLQKVKVTTTGSPPAAIDQSYTIQAADRTDSAAGAFSGTPGFDVYNSAANDGVLEFRFQYQFTVTGTYTLRASASDDGTNFFDGPAADLTVTIVAKITVAADPVNAAGTAQSGASWGAWTTDPGAASTEGVNFLKVTNAGTSASQAFTLDLAAAFTGATDSIPIGATTFDFACTQGTASQNPIDLAFTYGDGAGVDVDAATGSVTMTYSATGNVFYCKYKLLNVPDPLADETYSASFTAIAA